MIAFRRLPDAIKLRRIHSVKKTRPFVANLLIFPMTTTTKTTRTLAREQHTGRNAERPVTLHLQDLMTKLRMIPVQVNSRTSSSATWATSFALSMRLGSKKVQISSRSNSTTRMMQLKGSRTTTTGSRVSCTKSSAFSESSLARKPFFLRSGCVGRYGIFFLLTECD